MFWRERSAGGETLVRFKGVLDATSARDVRRFLVVEPGAKVVLDLGQAVAIDYYGLSVLVTEISRSGRTVSLRGLAGNHVRMLRYFGVDPAQLGLDECPRSDVG